MEIKNIEGCEYLTYIEGGVCAAKGFVANGIHCGLAHKALVTDGNASIIDPTAPKKNDLALLYSEVPCTAAAMYTTNKVKGAPLDVTREHLQNGKAQAVIVNSVNANTCNPDGIEVATQMCEVAARELGIACEDMIVASTGVIGQPLPIEPIAKAIPALTKGLSRDGNARAVEAIMTSDTHPKEVTVQYTIGGKRCTIGGMLKGSGMIHPNMATTLTFLTSDVAINSDCLKQALQSIVPRTLNRVSVDGDMSTNDMVCILANGMAKNPPIVTQNEDFDRFRDALYAVLMNLARMMARDGEGATKLIECVCIGALDDAMAECVAKSVITSSLFKAAIFGEDANCGRIMCAVGYAPVDFDVSKVSCTLLSVGGSLEVCKEGRVLNFSEELAKTVLCEEEIQVLLHLGVGNGSAVAWGCDLTYDYVRINGDYRS